MWNQYCVWKSLNGKCLKTFQASWLHASSSFFAIGLKSGVHYSKRVNLHSLMLRRWSQIKKCHWFSLYFPQLFSTYFCESYLANDLATETATYTYICLYQYTYLHRRASNVEPSCFFYSSASLLSTRATRQCAYASSGCDKKKLHYTVNFLKIWILKIS